MISVSANPESRVLCCGKLGLYKGMAFPLFLNPSSLACHLVYLTLNKILIHIEKQPVLQFSSVHTLCLIFYLPFSYYNPTSFTVIRLYFLKVTFLFL